MYLYLTSTFLVTFLYRCGFFSALGAGISIPIYHVSHHLIPTVNVIFPFVVALADFRPKLVSYVF